jgi:hypothetical protein
MNPLALFEGNLKGASLIKMDDSDNITLGESIIEEKALFYCEQCDVAKVDDIDATTVECVTCDNMMVKIGEVDEIPGVSELKKMVDDFNLSKSSGSEMIQHPEEHETSEDTDMAGNTSTEEHYDVEENKFIKEPVNPTPTIEDANPELVKEVGLPEGAPQHGAMKAEGTEHINPLELAERLLEVLKGRAEEKTEKSIYKQEEIELFEALSYSEMYKAVTNAHNTPPKGKPSSRGQYADPTNYKYPIDSPARIRAAMVYFNHPGQRTAGGYSMSQWASIGRRIASAANRVFGTGHQFSNGKIMGPNTKKDAEKAETILNLQMLIVLMGY